MQNTSWRDDMDVTQLQIGEGQVPKCRSLEDPVTGLAFLRLV